MTIKTEYVEVPGLEAGAVRKKFRLRRNQRNNGPANAHLISWPSKAQNIQNLENIW